MTTCPTGAKATLKYLSKGSDARACEEDATGTRVNWRRGKLVQLSIDSSKLQGWGDWGRKTGTVVVSVQIGGNILAVLPKLN